MPHEGLDERSLMLLPVVRGLAQMLGPECEVVLHDLTHHPPSVVAVENGFPGQPPPGQPSDERALRALLHDHPHDVQLHVASQGGRIVKALTVVLRDEHQMPTSLLALNLDISAMVRAQHALAALTTTGRPVEPACPVPDASADIRDVIGSMVSGILNEMGKAPAAMTREEKMSVVRRLDERGAFLVKRSAEQIAEALDVSRYTVFSYLKELRHDAGRRRAGS
jgi:predicted transcriptional regulator YheO